MTTYFLSYGCYLGMNHIIVDSEVPLETMEIECYYLAMEECDSVYGTHGFGTSEEEYLEENGSLEGYDELTAAEIEDAAEYAVEVYNPEEHDDYL